MFKKRKEKARGTTVLAKKAKGVGQIISQPNAMLEVEQIVLSDDVRNKLQVPAAAFAWMAVYAGAEAKPSAVRG